jgi:hypothetical protein
MNFCTSLFNQNVSGKNYLTVGSFNAKAFRFAVTAVLSATHTFFMSKKL